MKFNIDHRQTDTLHICPSRAASSQLKIKLLRLTNSETRVINFSLLGQSNKIFELELNLAFYLCPDSRPAEGRSRRQVRNGDWPLIKCLLCHWLLPLHCTECNSPFLRRHTLSMLVNLWRLVLDYHDKMFSLFSI